MNGHGGNLHSLRDLPGTYEKSGLVLCQEGGYDLASTPYMGLAVIEGISGIESGIDNVFEAFGSTIAYTDEVLPHQETVIALAESHVNGI